MSLSLSRRVIIAFGSNLGERERTIASGLRELDAVPGVKLVAVSGFYASDPVGMTDQPEFINGVAAYDTAVDAPVFLRLLQVIEREHGRVRDVPNGPRTLDLDMVFYDGDAPYASETLTLPHPRWRERPFVVAPLAELLAMPPLASDSRWDRVRGELVGLDKQTGVRRRD